MSEENVEIVRRLTDAFNRRDLPTFLSLCDPEIEIVNDRVLIGVPTYRGHRDIERFFHDMAVAWEALRVESIVEIVGGPDEFVVVGETSGAGKTTGAAFGGLRAAHLSFFHGKVRRVEFFATEREALEATGLSL